MSDSDVERCGLARLRAGTIERLVAEGHAVVESIDETGVRVTVASAQGGLAVRVEGRAGKRDEVLHAGTPCDATFVLDAISRIVELVGEVARADALAAPTDPSAQPEPTAISDAPVDEQPISDGRSRILAQLDLSARLNFAPDHQLGGGVALRARTQSGWEVGGRAELTAHAARGVTVLEPFLGLVGAYHPGGSALGAYAELGPLLHLASSDERSITRVDAALGAGAQLDLGPVVAQLLLYGRLRSLTHRVGSAPAFETGHFGLAVRLGAQL